MRSQKPRPEKRVTGEMVMPSARQRETREYNNLTQYCPQSLARPSLLSTVAAVLAIAEQNGSTKLVWWLRDLQDRIVNEQFRIAVVGQFKRGKTSLLNALLGAGDLLPVGTLPFTSILTIVKQGSHNAAEVVFQSGIRRSIPLGELRDYVTETGNPHNCKMVEHVEVFCAADILNDGVSLVNSPGFGSLYDQSTQIAYDYLPRIDAAIFVTSPEPPLTAAEIEFLKELISATPKVFVVMSKVDLLDAQALGDVLRFTQKAIARLTVPTTPRLYPVSVLPVATSNGPSFPIGIRELESDIRKFLALDREETFLASASRCLSTCICNLRAELESKLESAKEIGRALEGRRTGFDAEFQSADLEYKNSERLFVESVNRLGDLAENELRRFTESKRCELDAPLRAFVRDNDPTPKELLAGVLSDFAAREMDQWFVSWTGELEASLVHATTDTAERFLQSTNKIVEGLRTRIVEQCSITELETGKITGAFGNLECPQRAAFRESSRNSYAALSFVPRPLLRYWVLRHATTAARQRILATGSVFGKDLRERLERALAAFTKAVRGMLEDNLRRLLAAVVATQEQHENSTELQNRHIAELSANIRKLDHLSAALNTSTGFKFAMEA
jgi:GTP-binding protein EngB required for normal cell division